MISFANGNGRYILSQKSANLVQCHVSTVVKVPGFCLNPGIRRMQAGGLLGPV